MLVCRGLLPVEVPLNLTSRRCNEYDVAILKQKIPIQNIKDQSLQRCLIGRLIYLLKHNIKI